MLHAVSLMRIHRSNLVTTGRAIWLGLLLPAMLSMFNVKWRMSFWALEARHAVLQILAIGQVTTASDGWGCPTGIILQKAHLHAPVYSESDAEEDEDAEQLGSDAGQQELTKGGPAEHDLGPNCADGKQPGTPSLCSWALHPSSLLHDKHFSSSPTRECAAMIRIPCLK